MDKNIHPFFSDFSEFLPISSYSMCVSYLCSTFKINCIMEKLSIETRFERQIDLSKALQDGVENLRSFIKDKIKEHGSLEKYLNSISIEPSELENFYNKELPF